MILYKKLTGGCLNLFNYLGYKEILKELLAYNKREKNTRFTFQDMAKAARVQKTYLSKVLNRDGDLSFDQLYLACRYLEVTSEEMHYIELVYQMNLTYLPGRKKELLVLIKQIQKKYNKSETHLQADKVNVLQKDLSEYYLDPDMQIVHMALTVERFRRTPHTICRELQIPEFKLNQILEKLEKMQVIGKSEGRYIVLRENLHLADDAGFVIQYKIMQKVKSIELIQKLSPEQKYNFSVIFSATPEVKMEIQENFFKFLKKCQASVQNAKPQELYQLNFDLFSLF